MLQIAHLSSWEGLEVELKKIQLTGLESWNHAFDEACKIWAAGIEHNLPLCRTPPLNRSTKARPTFRETLRCVVAVYYVLCVAVAVAVAVCGCADVRTVKQAAKLAAGVSALRPLANVGAGVRDLVLIPIEE